MRVAVVGAGGVGSYFGGRLADTGDDIHLLARGRRLRAIRDNGLRISGVRGEFAVACPQPMIPLTSARATSCCSV